MLIQSSSSVCRTRRSACIWAILPSIPFTSFWQESYSFLRRLSIELLMRSCFTFSQDIQFKLMILDYNRTRPYNPQKMKHTPAKDDGSPILRHRDRAEDHKNLTEPSSKDEEGPYERDLSQKERIIEQNVKLKQQIFELSQQLEEILEKDRSRKKKLGPITANDDDQTLRQKKGELRKQQLQMVELKNKIQSVKRQLEQVYNNRNLVAKEQQLRTLRQELKDLSQQKQNLQRIKREQQKHLSNLAGEQGYQEKIEELKLQLARVKEQGKLLNEKIADAQKQLRKNHEQYVSKQEKLREMEQRLTNNKEKLRGKKPLPNITVQMLRNLQSEIECIEQEKKEVERTWQQKIRAIDLDYEQKKLEEEKKLLILKQKEKEYRINQLKIKQLRKLVRHNVAAEPSRKAEPDMSQFRHKRNIKYLQK